MNKIYFSLVIVTMLLAACKSKPVTNEPKMLNTAGIAAVGPYFTTDHKGNPVLCWSEQDGKDSLYRLKYAVYDQQKDAFGEALTVSTSAGCGVSAESMAKVAFKEDGTVIAIFAKRFPDEKNPYAGAIYYSMTENGGKNWSDAKFLHSDTSHAYGRSFFDVAKLKDGELAAIWLDGRYGKSVKGSALFFNRTEKGKGFATDTCLDKGTCECCRTDLLTDKDGNLHLAYRSIMLPNVLAGKQVRDMVYKLSTDNGQTFTPAKVISNDNWEIDGCPHSGPTLAVANHTLQAVWFTAGGSPGLYGTSATDSGFRRRNLITASGRHPQMVALADGKAAMVCEEVEEMEHEPMKMEHSHSKGGMMSHAPAGMSKIILRILKDGNPEKSIALTNGKQADHHAVLTTVNNGMLIAWVREGEKGSTIYYTGLKQ
ncbi:MAG: hypothetical protein P0Y49_12070 [Candidatus Pedobacter colombiensis]|uniref:Exo-alpha-sialidase n=1 Tax=Candidatus Pedobacter colombiensis TaxID=3121371 RepID=A0AAJ5W6M9_9SPHI|nr:hypothetical protein [Pedobacter sp.]WEK17532.1 MAG: hypothetical protein P0Y49_12070 [Pedobacter sp.]